MRLGTIIVLVIMLVLIAGGFYISYHPPLSLQTSQSNPFTASDLQDKPAPQFAGLGPWFNSSPLTLKDLKGKVVLVDFWTYSCINCVREVPHVIGWYDKYKDQGLIVIGVHTPEFAFEKNSSNVQKAVKRFQIPYPVALDNDYQTWNAYQNRYWPAAYLIDRNGKLVYMHFGEGNYTETENAIRSALGMAPTSGQKEITHFEMIKSPEMYFGTSRLDNLVSSQEPSTEAKDYVFSKNLPLNTFTLQGKWKFTEEDIQLVKASGGLRLHFDSGKVFMVAKSDRPIDINISIDGAQQKKITVQEPKLYILFDSDDYREHTLELEILEPGLTMYTFTFG